MCLASIHGAAKWQQRFRLACTFATAQAKMPGPLAEELEMLS